MAKSMHIDGRLIGPDANPYIVAEMSANHNGEIERAFRILDAAKSAGADAVKIQTYRADTITINHTGPEFMVHGGLWDGRSLYDLYEEAYTPWDWHEPIFKYGREIGITVFSSPFDPTAIDLLESLEAPAYKIASPEIIDLGLIRLAAETGKPVIISTGMANQEEISEAVETARSAGAKDLAVLHCTSAYPATPEEANLASIAEIANRFDVVAGLSDHTHGIEVSAAAVALGANLIEKHFTLARSDGGVDSAFSIEPEELSNLVHSARIARVSVGCPTLEPTAEEAKSRVFRRSLYIVAPVAKGEKFTEFNVRSIRPGLGMKPKHLDNVLGHRASRDLAFGEPLEPSMIEGGLGKLHNQKRDVS